MAPYAMDKASQVSWTLPLISSTLPLRTSWTRDSGTCRDATHGWNSHMELPHPLVRKVPRNIYSLSCSTSILNVRPERSSSRFERAASHTHCGSSPSACLCVCLLCLSLPGCLCLRVRLLGPVLPCASGRFFFMLASHRWQHSPPRSTHQHASRQCQKGRRALNAHSAFWSWAASVTTNDISCISSLLRPADQ